MDEQQLPISVFISYAHGDLDFVKPLRDELEGQGIRVLLDETIVRVGDSIVERLDSAFKEVDAIIVVLSQNYAKSKWSSFEYQTFLMQQEKSERSLPMPILIDDSPVPVELSGKRVVRFQDSHVATEAILKQLKSTFAERPLYRPSKISLPEVSPETLARPYLVEQALEHLKGQSPSVMIISGSWGSGKTTLAKLVANECVERNLFSIVLFLDAWSYPSRESLEHEIRSKISLERSIRETLMRERALIVLDGMDRIAASERENWLAMLSGFLFAESRAQIIIPADKRSIPELHAQRFPCSLTVLDVPPLSEEDVAKYLKEKIESPSERSNILKMIRSNKRLSELAKNPVLLATMAEQLSGTELSSITLESLFDNLFAKLSLMEQRILGALTYVKIPVSARTLSTLAGIKDVDITVRHLSDLVSKGMVSQITGSKYQFTHLTIREYSERKFGEQPVASQGGMLYVTIDPTLFTKEDFVEFLDSLNTLYVLMGGEELVIREDEVGRFADVGVFV